MVEVVNRSQQVRVAGIHPAPAYSRVVTMVAIAKWFNNPAYAISEAIGNPFRVLAVWVRVYWSFVADTPELYFRLTTGAGKFVNVNTVRDWEPVVPVIYDNRNTSWIADQKLFDFSWTMNRRYGEESRRLGLWTNLTGGGASIATVFASYEISEG